MFFVAYPFLRGRDFRLFIFESLIFSLLSDSLESLIYIYIGIEL